MRKIRINELARELEVKPQRILELLPELGVADKKTHSSSLDDDVADLVRRHFGVDGAGSNEPREPAEFHEAGGSEFAAPEVEEYPAEEKRPAVSIAGVEERVSGGGTAVAEPEEEAAPESAPGAVSEAGRSRPAPIRPPLQGRSGAGPAPTPGTPTIRPSAPFQPPSPRPSPAAPAARPAAPARPAASTPRPPAAAAPL